MHPPNALFALDLIRKELNCGPFACPAYPCPGLTARNLPVRSHTFPVPSGSKGTLVSVLDLDKTAVTRDKGGSPFDCPASPPSHGRTGSSDVSLFTMSILLPYRACALPEGEGRFTAPVRLDGKTATPLYGQIEGISGMMVGRDGLEPSTLRLSGVRSNHLSYRPISRALRSRKEGWWSLSGSNR